MFDIGSKKVPSGHVTAVCAGVVAGAGLAAATPAPPKNSPPSTAVAASERMITSRIMFPPLVVHPLSRNTLPTYQYHGPCLNITSKIAHHPAGPPGLACGGVDTRCHIRSVFRPWALSVEHYATWFRPRTAAPPCLIAFSVHRYAQGSYSSRALCAPSPNALASISAKLVSGLWAPAAARQVGASRCARSKIHTAGSCHPRRHDSPDLARSPRAPAG